jgi:HEAT repeat protein
MTISEADLKEFTQLMSGDLEKGDIDKVVSLFSYNSTLYETIGPLLGQGSMFVRLGLNMLLEDLKEIKPDEVLLAIPQLVPLLENENPTIRGDAADLIGIIGEEQHAELIRFLLDDPSSQVREVTQEAIEALQQSEGE